jgi:hypothetical protein
MLKSGLVRGCSTRGEETGVTSGGWSRHGIAYCIRYGIQFLPVNAFTRLSP